MKKAIKIENGIPIQMLEVSDDSPLPNGFTEFWTETQFLNYIQSITNIPLLPTKDEIHKIAGEYQDTYFDDRGLLHLMNIKQNLFFEYGVNINSNLTYQMIESVYRWKNKVWKFAILYDSYLPLYVLPNIDFKNDVGLPPCHFRDIIWTIDEEFQNLEPNRIFETDINYYINWA